MLVYSFASYQIDIKKLSSGGIQLLVKVGMKLTNIETEKIYVVLHASHGINSMG